MAVVLCSVLGLLLILAVGQIKAFLNPADTSSFENGQEVQIPYNSSTQDVASILEEEKIITNAFFFRLYLRYFTDQPVFQAGDYLLYPGMAYGQIVETLQQGRVLQEGIRFTIPEGYTVRQIAGKLAVENIVEEQEFLDACLHFDDAERFPFLLEVPVQGNYWLEGYLFPDTYEILPGTSSVEIISLMLARLQEVFNEKMLARLDEMEMSKHEALTLASIVEKEARAAEERPVIAAVFHNRLQSEAMPFLQSCATVQYALGEVKPVLTYQDLEVDSPYNTYRYPDLPPGPVASPGFAAMEATLYPADVDYLYFVYKEDGSGTHYFSRTLQEHNAYKRKAQRNR